VHPLCADVNPFFVHKNLRGRPVRPDSEFEHQVIRRASVNADETSLMEQFEVMRGTQEREVPFVIGPAL
jgi:hypothetical protein